MGEGPRNLFSPYGNEDRSTKGQFASRACELPSFLFLGNSFGDIGVDAQCRGWPICGGGKFARTVLFPAMSVCWFFSFPGSCLGTSKVRQPIVLVLSRVATVLVIVIDCLDEICHFARRAICFNSEVSQVQSARNREAALDRLRLRSRAPASPEHELIRVG